MQMPKAVGTASDLDVAEYARGTLCSLSFVSADAARAVHATSLHNQFERAGLAPAMKSALGSLQFLREAEPLDAGYWIPAPLRTVPLDGLRSLVVGAHPTLELQRHFPNARRAGAGRVAATSEVACLPTQPLAAWRGFDGDVVSTWTRATILSAVGQLAPSLTSDALEVFSVRERLGPMGRRCEPSWVRFNDCAVTSAWRGMELFRTRTSHSSYRYFLGQRTASAKFLEGPGTSDPIRMQFGLAVLNGMPLTLQIDSTHTDFCISFPLRPPTSVRRLLFALCEEETASFGRKWMCPSTEHMPTVQALLQELGCETKNS